MAQQDVHFAIVKATEGLTYVDPQFAANMEMAERNGLITGAYHYIWPNRDPVVAAKKFFDVAAGKVELPPFLDFETMKGMSAGEAVFNVWRFKKESEQLWGRKVVLYTYPSFWDGLWVGRFGYVDARTRGYLYELADNDLWLAHYGVRSPKVPQPWTTWKIWQYDGNGGEYLDQPGGKVDSDFCWFDGDKNDLVRYVAQTGGTLRPITKEVFPTPKSQPLWERNEGEHSV